MRIWLFCVLIALCNGEMASEVESAFKKSGIVPDSLTVAPKKLVEVNLFEKM